MTDAARTIAERIFDGGTAQGELEELLDHHAVPHERIGWDWYDGSVELHDVPNEYRLSTEAQAAIIGAGFVKIYVNHVDRWETHYGRTPGNGWRVSYPHKRKDDNQAVLVEAVVPSWPAAWFATGYAKVIDHAD